MDYLKKYNITDEMLEEIRKHNDDITFNKLSTYAPTVIDNLNYLISLGFTNIHDLLKYKLDVIYEPSLKKRINLGIVQLINKDIYNLEDFGY